MLLQGFKHIVSINRPRNNKPFVLVQKMVLIKLYQKLDMQAKVN